MNTAALERNVALFPWLTLCMRAYFWQAIFFLYFSSQLSINEVLRLEGIYFACVVALELPSGYCSDYFGRRPVLIISSLAAVAAYAAFAIGGSFGMLAAGQVLFAIAISFKSGSDVSLHFDSVAATSGEKVFAAKQARAEQFGFGAEAASALLGGIVAMQDLRWPYVLALVAAVGALVITLMMVEPVEEGDRSKRGIASQIFACVGEVRKPGLRWLFAFFVLMTVLNHVPYEFWQPYVDALHAEKGLDGSRTPLMAGMIGAATLWLARLVAGRSARLRDRYGTTAVLLAATLLQTAIITGMAVVLHPGILLLILLRSMPRGLMAAPLNAAIAPLVPTNRRATYLSLQSLVGRLAFSGTLFGLSFIHVEGEGDEWPTIASKLEWTAVVAVVGFVLLLLTSRDFSRIERGHDSPA